MTQGGAAQSPGAKALTYAEQNLGVHTVYAEALEAEEKLRASRENLRDLKRWKADEEEQYNTAELAFYSDTRAKLTEMSQAQFDKHIKVAINQHPELRDLRGKLAHRQYQIETAEYDIAVFRTTIEIRVARLHELGGYLGDLAEIKRAETVRLHPPAVAVQSPTTEDWPPASAVAGAAKPAEPATPTTSAATPSS